MSQRRLCENSISPNIFPPMFPEVQENKCEESRSTCCTLLKNLIKLLLVLVLFGIVITYASNSKFSNLHNDISELKSQLYSIQREIYHVGERKSDIEKQLVDISSTLPMLKEMTATLREGINGLDPASRTECDPENIRQLIQEEIEYYNADKTGRTDYALESSGGKIVSIRNTEEHDHGGATLSLFGIPLCSTGNGARAVIQAGVQPGECWAFKGSSGVVVIKLVNKIYVSGFSLEHLPQSISPSGDTTTAPKDFSIFGLQHETDTDGFFFGQYRYNMYGKAVQYFPVIHKSGRKFDLIEFRVFSNHGHSEYTCVYRLRVHGDLEKK